MPRGSQCAVFENRLDKSCPLEPNGHDLCNGFMNIVGCAHRIAWPTAHSARPDEGHCAAFYYFRTPFLASPLGTSHLMDVRWTLAEVAPSRCRQNGGPRGQLDRPGNRGYGDPESTLHSFWEPIRQILPIEAQQTRFVQWNYDCCGLRAQNCPAGRAFCQTR